MKSFLVALLVIVLASYNKGELNKTNWSLILEQSGGIETEVVPLPSDLSKPFHFEGKVNDIQVLFDLEPKAGYTVFKAKAISLKGKQQCYFSLKGKYKTQKPYMFNGEVTKTEIYRQSPHDPNAWVVSKIAEQGVPVVALKDSGSFCVVFCGSPVLYNNFTSQGFNLEEKTVKLSSGDNGQTPGLKPDIYDPAHSGNDNDQSSDVETVDGKQQKKEIEPGGIVKEFYHEIGDTLAHTFEGIIFDAKADNLNGLRQKVNQYAAFHFSNGRYNDAFGSLAFSTGYMNLRVNETGKSRLWVIPSIEYANTQYCRDAFWISTMLSPQDDAECLNNELSELNTYAEYPLFVIIWAYRSYKAGYKIDKTNAQLYIDAIEKRAKNGHYYSYDENSNKHDYQYWADLISFEPDDAISYNQGLYALALTAAKELGLKIKTDPALAIKNYQDLFNAKTGFYPISKMKNQTFGADPLTPDLIARVYFNRALLDSTTIRLHYNNMIKYAKTPYGFKNICLRDGSYLTKEMYDIPGYTSAASKSVEGTYVSGGSWFLYDNLFLIDAYLSGIKEAEEQLIWRVSLDFKIGGTTFECLNTKTGEPWKPNMGWNIAIYSIWRKLVDEGKADDKLFKAIDDIVKFEPIK